MRALGIDYGTKRIGLAIGDELGLASPLPALVEQDAEQRWQSLARAIREKRITDLVIGYPYNMDGSVGPMAQRVDVFAARLRDSFGLPVHLIDESLTSYAAEATLPKKKLRQVRDVGLIDSRAAAIVLQDFLDQKYPPGLPNM